MPGAESQGSTRQETLTNIIEAMSGWLEVATEDGYGPRPETAELVAAEIGLVLGFRAEEEWPLTIETTEVEVQIAVAV